MDASERPWVLDTGSPYGDDEHFIIDSEELETCVATVPFHGLDERDNAEANAKHIVKAVNMHDKLLDALKPLAAFAKTDFVKATIGGVAIALADVRTAAALLKEAKGGRPVTTETIINVAEGKRACCAGYDATKPLTPGGARALARRLGCCADAIDTAIARGDK